MFGSPTTRTWESVNSATATAHTHGAAHRIATALDDQIDDTTIASVAPAAVGPVSVSDTLTDVLYLQEPGDSTAISVNDIHQGQIGDCFLLSSIGELALFDPGAITNMIAPNANGTETVTLHLAATGGLPTFGTTVFQPASVTVDNNFPGDAANNGVTQDVVNGQKEIWVQVLEKAVATLDGGYSAIANGGNPVIALEELTGEPATWLSPASLTLSQLQADMAANDLIVMDTPASGSLPYGLYNWHAYMFEGLTTVNGTPMVQLLNPWGFDEPSPIPFSQLASAIVEVDIGQSPAGKGNSPPALVYQTANQTWLQGSRINLTIAANTFVDPQHQTLSYAATLSNGQPLPSWLSFNAKTLTLSGTVPSGIETLSLRVTATDTSGLSASETFQATVPAAAPQLAHQTPSQTWTEGTQLSLVPPANTFVDPQNEALTYAATLYNGQPMPSWLSCDPSTGTFSGTVPYASGAMLIKLTATDTSGLTASEVFPAIVVAPAPTATNPTPNQAWIAGSAVSLALAADTFTAVPGQTLSYAAVLPRGLTFNAATETISGTAPVIPGTYTIKVMATETSGLSASETFQAVVTARAPTVRQTPDQSWTAGQKVSLATSFTDPQGESLTYRATQANGSVLPKGLTFNASTGAFGGTPTAPGSYSLTVTATDASGLSASETFRAVVRAAAPTPARQVPNLLWTDGQTMKFIVPAGVFADPQGSPLTYSAYEIGGADKTSWMHFNPTVADFFGTVPAGLSGTIGIGLVATNGYGFSAAETFGLTFAGADSHAVAAPFTSPISEMLRFPS